ncbi:fungal-specific transcription factor domain-containing protein [Trametes maxima]|nr:fungal-specific transcription factor domain-containing protein [Trametes maxima]
MASAQPGSSRKLPPQRACDVCRKKKGDGTKMPDYKCSNCITFGTECTYDAASKRPTTKRYVESLETRLKKMEELLLQVRQYSHVTPSRSNEPLPAMGRPHNENNAQPICCPPTAITSPVFGPTTESDADDLDASDNEMEASLKLIDMNFRRLGVHDRPHAIPYFGKSSSIMLLNSAVDMKLQYTGVNTPLFPPFGPTSNASGECGVRLPIDDRPTPSGFPPSDLLDALVAAYFKTLNIYVPLLHRQTFDQGVAEGLHLRDPGFGAVVLLVCANGARWIESSDPRLSEYGSQSKPGWVWFIQVEKARKSPFATPQLYDLQKYILMGEYIAGYSPPHTTWTIVGLGIRVALDLGIHRKKTYSSMSRVDGELWKRAFWCLVAFDRSTSFLLGRPCALQDEDFDVDLVEECDDEYWDGDDPITPFKQPPGKPSTLSFLNCLNRLMQILAFASRTIYSINKSKALLGFVGEEWEEKIVAELDSALNKWIDTVPDHLRWDPHRDDPTFMTQSAALYCTYYQLQIFVHRPFLPTLSKSSRLSLPSLAICTNAARSCVHVNDVQYRRTGFPNVFNRLPIFTAGIVLLLNLWAGKRAGFSNQSAVADVQKCLDMLEILESDYRVPGRLWDLLNMLYSAGDFKAPESEAGRKRARDPDESAPSHDSQPSGRYYERAGNISSSTSKKQHLADPLIKSEASASGPSKPNGASTSWRAGNADSPSPLELPMHTEELERVPFHQGFSPFYDPTYAQEIQKQPEAGLATALSGISHSRVQSNSSGTAMTIDSAGTQPTIGPYQAGPATFANPYVSAAHVVPPSASQSQETASQFAQRESAASRRSSEQHPTGGFGMLGVGLQALTQEDLALADDTLELWSVAPMSMNNWGDWGAFINNVSSSVLGPPPASHDAEGQNGPVF